MRSWLECDGEGARDGARACGQARRFATHWLEPSALAWEAEGRVPPEAWRAAGEAGLCGLLVPPELGGSGLGVGAFASVMALLARSCMASAFALEVHNNLAATLARHAPVPLRERHLASLLSGERVGAFLLTEPQGGSDAAAIRTRARREGSGWVLEGEKAWVSNATTAGLLSVYAQTDPDLGSRGIGCFLVEAESPGVVRLPPYRLLGGHALGTAAFRFEGCRVADEAVLRPPGEGFRAAMAGIDLARLGVAAMCCGMLERALTDALAWCGERHAFGRPILDFQGVEFALADVATDLAAARALVREACEALDGRAPEPTLACAHAKKHATRVAFDGIARCMQAMGAPGLELERVLARHLACARMAHLLDGTTEIQNVVIGRGLRRGLVPGSGPGRGGGAAGGPGGGAAGR